MLAGLMSLEGSTGRSIAAGTWVFVTFHELGHALVDILQLPVTGREEDAVDGFSTVLLLQAELAEAVLQAAIYWAVSDTGMYGQQDFADEHSLNSQRYYNLLCWIYGSDPQRFADLVAQGHLPEERAGRCMGEHQQLESSWTALLRPHLR